MSTFRFPKLLNGTHGKLKAGSDIKKKWAKCAADIKSRKANKFGIGGAAAAKQHAKDGIFTKASSGNVKIKDLDGSVIARDGNKEKDVFETGYKNHILREKKKKNYKEQQLEIGRAQVVSMNRIGISINCMTMDDRDYYAAFKDYVMNEYSPENAREDVLKLAADHKDDCIDLWRVVERKPDVYTTHRKDQRIRVLYERWNR